MRLLDNPRQRISRGAQSILSTPFPSVFCFCVFAFLSAVILARRASWRDPGSWFFEPSRAYDPIYSAVRSEQALDLIAAASADSYDAPKSSGTETSKLCLAIPSVARPNARYLRTAVGSLLQGLTVQERQEIYFIALIPHSDPTRHPAYNEPWLAKLSDEVIGYDNLSSIQLDHIKALEKNPEGWREKELYDYKYALRACQQKTSAEFIAIIEDDTIAMDGWYHRTFDGLALAEDQTTYERQEADDFLYLRLFYTEEFLGFNSEDWFVHTFLSLVAIFGTGVALTFIGSFLPFGLKRYLAPRFVILICVTLVPLLVVLFFATGKVTTLPLPHGVNKMPQYGCCSQGLVFPRNKIEPLTEWYDAHRLGFVDTLMEQYADEHDEIRWALTPPPIQHVGRKSSKKDNNRDKNQLSIAERLWNFDFELNTAEQLRVEHLYVTEH